MTSQTRNGMTITTVYEVFGKMGNRQGIYFEKIFAEERANEINGTVKVKG